LNSLVEYTDFNLSGRLFHRIILLYLSNLLPNCGPKFSEPGCSLSALLKPFCVSHNTFVVRSFISSKANQY